jgi:hypothetical protein
MRFVSGAALFSEERENTEARASFQSTETSQSVDSLAELTLRCPQQERGVSGESVSLAAQLRMKRDYYAGALMMLIGLGAAAQGSTYHMGTLVRMGPGFFPVALGVILVCLGIVIAGTAFASAEGGEDRFLPDNPQWFGWLCLISGPILFIILGVYGGMIPAIFGCVFVCALGDKTSTLKGTLIMSVGVTVFGVILFSYLLGVPLPLLRGITS